MKRGPLRCDEVRAEQKREAKRLRDEVPDALHATVGEMIMTEMRVPGAKSVKLFMLNLQKRLPAPASPAHLHGLILAYQEAGWHVGDYRMGEPPYLTFAMPYLEEEK